jgi:hypothetical protein
MIEMTDLSNQHNSVEDMEEPQEDRVLSSTYENIMFHWSWTTATVSVQRYPIDTHRYSPPVLIDYVCLQQYSFNFPELWCFCLRAAKKQANVLLRWKLFLLRILEYGSLL